AMASVNAISRDPDRGESCIRGAPVHAGSEFWFGGKDDLFWHMGGSTALGILRPALGQIQCAIHQGMLSLAGIGQKDPDLAVFNAPCCPTVLSLHAHGLLPLLEKARFINDQHPIGTGKHLTYIG